MTNQYLKNLNKIEFVVTYACTGRCKHCSQGEDRSCDERINPQLAYDAVHKIVAASSPYVPTVIRARRVG